MAIMGIGISSGENRALEAAERAISHPLLDDINISGAKGVLMNITSNSDLTMEEMTEAPNAYTMRWAKRRRSSGVRSSTTAWVMR
jgi:cell division GTPase FtsZ